MELALHAISQVDRNGRTTTSAAYDAFGPEPAPLTVRPGVHRLEIPPNALTTLNAFAEFSCAAGDLRYAAIEIESGDASQAWKHLKEQVHGSIDVSVQRPDAFREQPMLIWRDGQWLVAQEP